MKVANFETYAQNWRMKDMAIPVQAAKKKKRQAKTTNTEGASWTGLQST